MIRRLLLVAGWLAAGAALAGGLYWAFLNTPESNAATLTLSAVLAVGLVASIAMVVNSAVLLGSGASLRASVRAAVRGIPYFLLAVLPAVLLWWIVLEGDGWMSRHSGELSAWFIAQFGWTRIDPLFAAQAWVSRWLRYGIAPVVMLCLLSVLLTDGARGLRRSVWVRRLVHWRTLAVATLVFIALFALPWQLTAWRPVLPASWIEPAVAAVRLGVAGAAIALGSAALVAVSTWGPRSGAHAVPADTIPSASR